MPPPWHSSYFFNGLLGLRVSERSGKKLSRLDATLLVMGGIIGVGIFFTPQLAAQLAGSGPLVLGVWLFGGLVALCAAFTFAELGATFPQAGGWFVYLREAFGRLPAFLFAWVVLTVISTGAAAAVSKFGVAQLHVALPGLGVAGNDLAQSVSAALVVAVITAVALSGIKSAARVQNLCMLTKLLVLAALVVCGLVLATPGADGALDAAGASPVAGGASFTGALSALKPVFFAYGGWQMVAYIAPQVRDPERTLPRAIVFGVTGVIAIYLIVNYAYLNALGIDGLAADPGFATHLAREASGDLGERLVAGGMAVSALGWCIVLIITSPWLYVAMAREGLFFESVGRLHPTRGVPSLALCIQLAAALAYIFAGNIDTLVNAVVFVEWIFHGLVAWALIRLRSSRSDLTRPYTSPLFPLAPLVYLVAALLVVGSTIANDANEVRLTGLAVVALGAVVFRVWGALRSTGS